MVGNAGAGSVKRPGFPFSIFASSRHTVCVLTALTFCATAHAADVTLSLQEAAARKPVDFSPLNEGRSVIVTGQVSARAIHIANVVHLAVQEREHGLILETSGTMLDHFAPGDWVEARGHILGRWGLPVVAVSKIALASTGAPPWPVSLSLAEVQKLD